MHPVIFVTTAVLAGAFLLFCVGAWRGYRAQVKPRPFVERAAMAIIFAGVGWQALTWLGGDHALASHARVVAVWVQLFSAFGISSLMIATGWLVHRGSEPE